MTSTTRPSRSGSWRRTVPGGYGDRPGAGERGATRDATRRRAMHSVDGQGDRRHRLGPRRRLGHRAAPRPGRRARRGRGVEARPARRRGRRARRASASTCSACASNIMERAEIDAMVAATVERFGRVDGLVNNAQTFRPLAPMASVSARRRRRLLHSGVKGSLWAMQAVYPHMATQGWGRIVNFASSMGITGGPGFGAYNASKEAIRALTRTAAREWAPDGIVVNCIAPAAADHHGEAAQAERGLPHLRRELPDGPPGRSRDSTSARSPGSSAPTRAATSPATPSWPTAARSCGRDPGATAPRSPSGSGSSRSGSRRSARRSTARSSGTIADDVEAGGPSWAVLGPHAGTPIERRARAPPARWRAPHGARRRRARARAHFPSTGGDGDAAAAWWHLRDLLATPPPEVLDALTRPPQTNEVGRSASLVAGLLHGRERDRAAAAAARARRERRAQPARSTATGTSRTARGWGDPTSAVRFVDLWPDATPPFDAPATIASRAGLRPRPDRRAPTRGRAHAALVRLARPGPSGSSARAPRSTIAARLPGRRRPRRRRRVAARAARGPGARASRPSCSTRSSGSTCPTRRARRSSRRSTRPAPGRPTTRRSPGCGSSRRPRRTSRPSCGSRRWPGARRRERAARHQRLPLRPGDLAG